MPESTVIPEIAYPNIGEAIAWLTDVFGLRLRIRIGEHRAQMNIGEGSIVLVTRPEHEVPCCSVMVRVMDVDEHYARALQRGADVTQEPQDYPYGERQYSVRDLAGNHWKFSQSIADVAPEDWGGESGERT